MWQPLEAYGLRRIFAVVSMFAVAFVAFRIGFGAESAEKALAAIGIGSLTVALAVGLLTMNRPWRIFAIGPLVALFWGAIFGGGVAIFWLCFGS